MNKKTYVPDQKFVIANRKWHLINAKNEILGRLSVKIARLLTGKCKVYFTNYIDCGDFVIVINANELKLSGKKSTQKNFFSYSGYPGGLKLEPYSKLMVRNPEKVLFMAVKGMLPKNKLSRKQMTRLKIFRDGKHVHYAQFKINNK
ncbi:MAG: 50S ribosomal protein L13 [Endomicrobium sp.]|jgi:large subunit ribosomal protein L13|nr:50S ribosomal protein L13 [Endomicrobium sp.]